MTFCHWNLNSLTAHDTKVHVPRYNEISLLNETLWNIFRSYIPNHMHVKKVAARLRISFQHLLMDFEKPKKLEWKKLLEMSSFYTCVPKTTIIQGTVSNIQWDNFFWSSWAIFYPLPQNKHLEMSFYSFYTCALQMTIMMYCSWDIKHDKTLFVILGYFLPFYSPLP